MTADGLHLHSGTYNHCHSPCVGNYEVSEKSFLFVIYLADLSLGGISLACGCLHVCCIRNAGTNVISVCVQVCSVSCIIAYQLLCV